MSALLLLSSVYLTDLTLSLFDLPDMTTSQVSSEPEDRAISILRQSLTSETTPLPQRFRALFSLKHLAGQTASPQTSAAIQAIAAAFKSPSALLKHELAYCLGQTRNLEAIPHLLAVLQDHEEDAMCRHEAAEALGALGDIGSVSILQNIKNDDCEPTVVRETCEIAIDRILWETSDRKANEVLKKRQAQSMSIESFN